MYSIECDYAHHAIQNQQAYELGEILLLWLRMQL